MENKQEYDDGAAINCPNCGDFRDVGEPETLVYNKRKNLWVCTNCEYSEER